MLQSAAVEGEGARLIGAAAIGRGADGEPVLLGCRCGACGCEMVPPVPVCPVCGGEEMSEAIQPSEGDLYSYTVVHVGSARWRRPLVLGYVDLDNGVRVFTQLEGGSFSVGDRVEFTLASLGRDADDAELVGYVFRRKEGAE